MQLQTREPDSGAGLRPVPPPQRRRSQRPRRRSQRLRAAAIALASGTALVAVLATPLIVVVAWAANTADAMVSDLPDLPSRFEAAPQRSVVLDRTGKRLATLQVENRMSVDIDEVPDHVINAVLATEDHTFWGHGGVNWGAIARSALHIAFSGEIDGGGSTITQQVVKNRFVGDEQSLDRKFTEAALATEVERTISKKEILETYLNDTYFGNGVFGIATAAEYYWSTSVEKLTPAQGALLAGIIRAPERNNPVDSPEQALQRRNIVLGQMSELDLLSAQKSADAADEPIDLKIKKRKNFGSPFLTDIVRAEIQQDPALGDTPEERWDTALRGGLKIRTTLHAGLQRAAEKSIDELLEHKKKDPLASIVAVDPATGEVLAAAVGPKDYGEGPGQTTINPAMPGLGGSGRPPGSTFKAFELVTALEHDVPRTRLFTSGPRYTSQHPSCPSYTVSNYGGADLGPLDMAGATAKSSNTYFVHLMDIAGGPEALVETAHRMGIESELHPLCASVLGSENVFPLEMASAFGTLANDGKHCETRTIRAILDHAGDVVSKAGRDCERAVDKDVAHTVTAMLEEPIRNGTAAGNGQIGRPAAGKTGTTTDNFDAWFVGYVPQLSVATWVGHEIPETLVHPLCGEVTGGCLPTMLWQRFMTRALDKLDLAVEDFPKPPPPPVREIPSVVGMSEDEARATLFDADFQTAVETVDDAQPEGIVVSQSPGGGEAVVEGSVIIITVSTGVAPPPPEPPPPPIDLDPPDLPDLPDLPDIRRPPDYDRRRPPDLPDFFDPNEDSYR